MVDMATATSSSPKSVAGLWKEGDLLLGLCGEPKWDKRLGRSSDYNCEDQHGVKKRQKFRFGASAS